MYDKKICPEHIIVDKPKKTFISKDEKERYQVWRQKEKELLDELGRKND